MKSQPAVDAWIVSFFASISLDMFPKKILKLKNIVK